MKKKLILLLVFVTSFVSITNVKADYSDGCDHAKVYTDTYYNETEWDVWVNVCDPEYTGQGFSVCLEDKEAAKNWCKHEYRKKTYKGSYHLVSSGKCSEQSVCYCNTFNVSCKLSNWCTSYYLTTDVDGDGVYDEADGDVKGNCKTWRYSSSYGSAKVTVDGKDTGACADENTKPTNDAAVAACEAAYPERTVTSATVGTIAKTAYQVTYPMYICKSQKYLVKNMREAKYYIKNNKGENIDVYCINPEHEAPNDVTGANEIPIEVSSCENSFSTPDCGYANIMIEGYYRKNIKNNNKYSYAVIGAAMRLWGAHVGAAGYNDTGIADEDDNTEPPEIDVTKDDDNGDWLKFVPDSKSGKYVNVFKETSKFMLENATASGYRPGLKDIYEVSTGVDMPMNIHAITCDEKNMGVFCGTGVQHSDYLYSLSLFVNTVQGNPDLQAHYDEILKSENPNYVASNDPTGAAAEILTDKKIKITYTLKRNVEIDCNTLDDSTANDLGCTFEQKVVIKDNTGKTIYEGTHGQYDYCKKNYCYTTVEIDKGKITCDIVETIKVIARKYQSCEDNTKKYVSCSSSPENPTQIMFGFDPSSNCSDRDEEEREIITDILNCTACNDAATVVAPNCDANSNNEKYVERSASDPSLNCIMHKSSLTDKTNQKGKRYYDYSHLFGVNTNICKVYCSDKVTYYMAPKKDVYSALQLKYDIEREVFPGRADAERSSHALTSIVKVQRDCASQIFYDNIPFDYNKDWELAYGVPPKDKNGDQIVVNNWKELFDAVRDKSSTSQAHKENILTSLIYDLYSCNFFSDAKIKELTKVGNKNIIGKPSDSKNAYSVAIDLLNNTASYCNDKDCVKGSITYEGGAQYVSPQEAYLYTGQNGKDPALSTEESMFNGLNVKYCNKGECFRGKVGENFPEDYSAAHTSYGTEKVKWNNSTNVTVPTNDYAIFSYTMEADLYNSTRYQIEEYTGNVSVVKDNKYNDKLLTLDKYLYPIAQSVQNRCLLNNDTSSPNYGLYVCDVNYDIRIPVISSYNKLTDFEKNQNKIAFYRNQNSDDLLDKLDTASKYSCVYTVNDKTVKGDSGFIFRNIDLNNPVPHERNGSNWDATNNGDFDYSTYIGEVISEIKQSGEDNLYGSDYYLEYSYELTPETIEEIRRYNETHNYYEKVIPGSCRIDNEKNFDCKSYFLRDLHDDLNSFNIKIYKDDGKSQFTIDKEKAEQGGN